MLNTADDLMQMFIVSQSPCDLSILYYMWGLFAPVSEIEVLGLLSAVASPHLPHPTSLMF